MQFVVAIVALLVGAAFTFGGVRFFMLLLPIWGFVVGFTVGTDAVTALFGDGAFATATSWVVGFVLALVFAVLSYFFYWAAIVFLGGAVGYMIGSAAWGLIGNEYGLIAFALGLACGVVLALVVAALNVPRLLVIVLTGLGGAATMLAGWFVLIGTIPVEDITWLAIGAAIRDSWFYLIVWGVIAAAGMLAQLRAPAFGSDRYEMERSAYRYG